MGVALQVQGIHSVPFTEIWLHNISIRNLKELLIHFAQAISDIHTVKNRQKLTYSQQDVSISQLVEKLMKKLLMGLFHTKSFFQFFCKQAITGNDKKKKLLKPLSVVRKEG